MLFEDDDQSPCGTIEFLGLPTEKEIFDALITSTDCRWPVVCIRNNNPGEFKSIIFSVISISISYKNSNGGHSSRDLQVRIFTGKGHPRLIDVKYFSLSRSALLDRVMTPEDAESLYEKY